MIPGCILAGGQGRRLGGKGKAFINLSGKPLINHSIDNMQKQVSELSVNTRSSEDFNIIDIPIIIDEFDKDSGGSGPLAGIFTAIKWAKKIKNNNGYVATIPVDIPFVPEDFISRMLLEINIYKPKIAIASSNNRLHPVAAIWSLEIYKELYTALSEGIRKIDNFTCNFDTINVDWKYKSLDPFFNINTPNDLAYAEKVL